MGSLSPPSHHNPWRAWRCSPRPSRLVGQPRQATARPHGRALPALFSPACPETPSHPSVLRRIKVTFLDTVVRVEHSPGDGERGVAVEVHVQR